MQTFTGKEYLKIDVANCFGLDKLKWNDRLHWVNNNEPVLEDQAIHAESPILFRKAVRALRTVQRGEFTNHVMGLDATASGLQIMAAMSGCHDTAEQVNLTDTGERRDVYQTVADRMNKLPGVNVDKPTVKKPIMTVFYGSTAQPKSIFGDGPELIAFYQTLEELLTGAYDLMRVFQQNWNPGANFYKWTLPDGHVAKVPVVQTLEKNLEIDEAGHLRFAYRAKVLEPKIRGRALAANIVHSVDAWIVRQMVAAAKSQGFWLAPIHDCFYASPKYMNQVRENYVKILAWLARNSLVSSILTEINGRHTSYRQLSTDLDKAIMQSNYSLS